MNPCRVKLMNQDWGRGRKDSQYKKNSGKSLCSQRKQKHLVLQYPFSNVVKRQINRYLQMTQIKNIFFYVYLHLMDYIVIESDSNNISNNVFQYQIFPLIWSCSCCFCTSKIGYGKARSFDLGRRKKRVDNIFFYQRGVSI